MSIHWYPSTKHPLSGTAVLLKSGRFVIEGIWSERLGEGGGFGYLTSRKIDAKGRGTTGYEHCTNVQAWAVMPEAS